MAFEMPRANKPEDVGLSSQRLQRIRDTLQADIDKGLVPGAVLLIARRGQIANSEALGYRDREDGAVMTPDTIFRITSMTKPVVSVAAMMLAEEGKLLIANPVSRYIPAFADLKVAANSDDPDAKALTLEPLQREMTVQDLRPDLRASHRPASQAGLRNRQCYRRAANQCRNGGKTCQGPPRLPARHDLSVRRFDRHARARR
jgi:hypothetical protein